MLQWLEGTEAATTPTRPPLHRATPLSSVSARDRRGEVRHLQQVLLLEGSTVHKVSTFHEYDFAECNLKKNSISIKQAKSLSSYIQSFHLFLMISYCCCLLVLAWKCQSIQSLLYHLLTYCVISKWFIYINSGNPGFFLEYDTFLCFISCTMEEQEIFCKLFPPLLMTLF